MTAPVEIAGGAFGCSRFVGLWDHTLGRIVHKPCGSFKCRACGPKRITELGARILQGLKTPAWRSAYFLTVTLDPSTCDEAAADGTAEQARYGTQCLESCSRPLTNNAGGAAFRRCAVSTSTSGARQPAHGTRTFS